MAFPYGAQVLSGANAVANDHNNARKDGLTRWFKFEVKGPAIVGNGAGGSFILPFGGTVQKIKTKCSAGSGTVRINTGATVVDSSIAVGTSVASDTSFSLSPAAVAADDLLTMDIQTSTSMTDLVVMVEILPTP